MSSDMMNPPEVEQSSGDMNFTEFLAWSQDVSRIVPGVRRLCETRIARSFASIQPTVDVPVKFATVHRCDLARLWCEVRGLSNRNTTALICEGVRHGLGLIFKVLAQARQRVALPRDVYPVYWRIASEAGLEAVAVETFPYFELRAILETSANWGTSVVVLPFPLKLHGRRWTEQEVDQAVIWLREKPQRRLILDGVYSFGLSFETLTKRLLETGQVIYVDSLSKGWLHELVLGVAIVPERDLDAYSNSFRSLQMSQANLFRARRLLSGFHRFPIRLTEEIERRRDTLSKLLNETGMRVLPAGQGYFIAIEGSASVLLKEHRFLTMPATVFGSSLLQWSVASALPPEDSI
jgi:DNA-binding transcriptional MocR family regulator